MRKILVGMLIVCLSLGLAGMAMAAEFSWSGSAEFAITGGEGQASGLFGGSGSLSMSGTVAQAPFSGKLTIGGAEGDTLSAEVTVTKTSGIWEGSVTVKGSAPDFTATIDNAYLKMSAEAFTLTMNPIGIDNSVFDIYSKEQDGAPSIPSNPGLKLELPMEGFSFYVITNNSNPSGTEIIYNFAGGVDLSIAGLNFGLTFNSNADDSSDWYGSSYGVKVIYSLDALKLTGEYGAFNPGATGVEAGSGYYAELSYSLTGGGSFTLSYTGADKNLAGVGNQAAYDHAYSRIVGEYTAPIAEAVDLTFSASSEDTGKIGEEAVTSWEAKIGFSF